MTCNRILIIFVCFIAIQNTTGWWDMSIFVLDVVFDIPLLYFLRWPCAVDRTLKSSYQLTLLYLPT